MSTEELILERDLTDAVIVRKLSPTCQTLLNIRKCTQEKWVDPCKLKIPVTETLSISLRSELMHHKNPVCAEWKCLLWQLRLH